MKNLKITAAVVIVLFTGGCASSISQFQSAKTLEPGEVSFGVASGMGYAVNKEDSEDDNVRLETARLIEGWLQAGIVKGWDAGGKVSLPSSSSLFVRRGILNEDDGDPFSAALGGGYTVGEYNYKNIAGIKKEVSNTDISIPVYFSKDLLKGIFTIYTIPTFNIRDSKVDYVDTEDEPRQYTSNMLGGTMGVGINLGSRIDIMAEYNMLRDIENSDLTHEQAGLGGSVDFGF
ncbi:MAG: hypothetical protein U9R36_02395 [Elusimicrobiota bacterium]|nr:hypothetical protein [Elusimicrobiota bacterium]